MIAGIAQLGERQTEDLKVTCSIHVHRTWFMAPYSLVDYYFFLKYNELVEIALLMNFYF